MEFSTLTEKEFRDFSEKSDQRTFLHTPEIGKIREKAGWQVEYLGVKEGKKVVAATMMTSKVRHFGYKEYYAPRGLLVDYHKKELLAFFTNQLKDYVKKNKGYEFRIDPYVVNVERDINGDIVEGGVDNREIPKYLEELGYKRVPKEDMEQVGWMYALDTAKKSEEDILKEMKSNTRNIIRKTLKYGIEVIELTREDLPLFYKIMVETGKRKDFHIRKLQYFEDMYDAFHPRGEIKFLLTSLNLKNHIRMLEEEMREQMESKNKLSDSKCNDGKRKEIDVTIDGLEKRIKQAQEIMDKEGETINLSSAMFLLVGDEIIYLAGANYEEYMYYNSQYLIQWEMIKYCIDHKFRRYNFYGITGNFDRNDKDYGMYEFKTRFGGYVEELIGEYTYPTSWVYYMIHTIHKISSKIK